MSALSKSAPLSLAVLLAAAAVAQGSDTKEVHRTLAIDRDGRVSVKTYKGSVTVTTWDKPEIRVDALGVADTKLEPGAMLVAHLRQGTVTATELHQVG